MQILFVFTNYNNSSFSSLALDSISRFKTKGSKVILVDNNSSKLDCDNLRILEKRYEFLEVIYSKENLGYFKGLRLGITHAKKEIEKDDVLVIGNNDLTFPDDFVESIQKNQTLLEKHPVIAPNIVTLDGVHQNPHVISGISQLREVLIELYHMNYTAARLISFISRLTNKFTDRDDESYHEIPQEIYQGYGACYILSPVFLAQFENLWAPSFLMYEEFFLAQQLAEKNYKTYYEPSILVNHSCKSSTGQLPGKKRWEYSRESHKIYRKFVRIW